MDLDQDLLIQTFLVESQENLISMEQALMRLEKSPEDDNALGAIFRGAHTIKGNAGTLGFRAVADFAHVFEDVLDRLRRHQLRLGTALASLLLHAIDVIREALPLAIAGDEALPPEAAGVRASLSSYASAPMDTDPSPDVAGGDSVPGSTSTPAAEGTSRSLRVDVDKLDKMLLAAGEIAIVRGRLRALLERMGIAGQEALEVHRESDRLFLELQEQIMQARMVPLGPVFRRHERTVRDIALGHGKQAYLVVEGQEVEVDTTVIEQMRDPLTHMIRNAIDHGIEPPDVRVARGKDPQGRVTLRARRESGSIVIEVEDDGGGLDFSRIREAAAARGIDAARLREADLKELIFSSGFSTAASVTDLSGRGVGMEVVRRNTELLRGTIGVESRPGAGTTVSVRVPLTLAIIDGFSVGAGDETYIVPLDTVVECIELPADTDDRSAACGVVNVRGEALPFLRLRDLFGLPGDGRGRENVVVVRQEQQLIGIAVDALHGQSQTVIKPLGKTFKGLVGVAGATILGSGRVALILDVAAVTREAMKRQTTRQLQAEAEATS